MDIDKILVVTFTNAAASEMRQRILDAIYKYLDEHPEDEHMQKQTVLIGKSNICTIHSFCLDVIKNNFFEIDVSPNFRIGNQTEIELLKQEVIEEIFEQKYLDKDAEFLKLINTYTSYKSDDHLKEIILKIYKYIQASPFPEEWLNESVEKFNLKDSLEKDFATTEWGRILIKEYKEELENCILELKSIQKDLRKYTELEKFEKTISIDIQNLEELKINLDTWDKAYNLANELKWNTWPRDTKIILEQKEIAKKKRDDVKDKFNKVKNKILISTSKKANEDIYEMYEILKALQKIIIEFTKLYTQAKKENNIIDFNDIEHLALQILVKKENNQYKPTEIAKHYMEKFEEIAIDEYQDSNLVQEYILLSVSKGNNIFMVGDVKQSIYKFRQARPELFISKYETYKEKESQKANEDLKIQLYKNFRSRKNILDITNLVFENIMSKELGDINYNEKEYLNLGANYTEEKEIKHLENTELLIVDVKEKEEKEQEEEENIENSVIEAKMVANKIKELIKDEYQVYDKDTGYRNVTYKDIVILLRATSKLAPIYEKELNNLNIPVFSDTNSQYLETTEIQTILSILKIIDNPLQDIPLVCVLRSPIYGFTDDDLIEIKLQAKDTKYTYFYEILEKASKNEKLKINEKIKQFIEQLKKWRIQEEYLSLDELIWQIYLDTGYYNYVSIMPNGEMMQENLKILFETAKEYENASFKGLFNFINYIDRLKNNNGDMDSAKLIGENENVVRIMSIHKSKGLEFPIVFLSNTAKGFNFQDINETILLHQDIGIGPKYIDYERKIEYNTLAKLAIAYKTKTETISEEMRILYVALTRAKEKLFITGLSKDIEKDLKDKKKLLDMYNEEKIQPNIIKKYKSYLDWLELVYLKNEDSIKTKMNLTIYTKEEIKNGLEEAENTKLKIAKEVKNAKINEELKSLLEWTYGNIEASTIQAKTSVTKIKEMDNDFYEKAKEKIENLQKPKFLTEQDITKAQVGTLMHLCIQKLDEKLEYDDEKIQNMIDSMVSNEVITAKETEYIDKKKLLEYTKSDIYASLKKAKEIHKEQPFYINMEASEVYKKDVNEKILVQGVIDLYYIDENDNVILVDYKTDLVHKNIEELVSKYETQLLIYKRALEKSLNKIVDKVYIYSVYLGKAIEIKYEK